MIYDRPRLHSRRPPPPPPPSTAVAASTDMRTPSSLQLFGFVLWALCLTVSSQERQWRTISQPGQPSKDSTASSGPSHQDDRAEEEFNAPPVLPAESLVPPESAPESTGKTTTEVEKPDEGLLVDSTEEYNTDNPNKTNLPEVEDENYTDDLEILPNDCTTSESLQSSHESMEESFLQSPDDYEDTKSMSGSSASKGSLEVSQDSLNNLIYSEHDALGEFIEIPYTVTPPRGNHQESSIQTSNQPEKMAQEPFFIIEDPLPMFRETIINKKTTVFLTIADPMMEYEPAFVNLTGIKNFTGRERMVFGGCLDLSDLELTGEEVKEVIHRMARHKFYRVDLSGNNIVELAVNTFSPVAHTVKVLRLDGNPLRSGGALGEGEGEAGLLQRGGLFHLTELRELNLSSCGLEDIDFFTPWNSNHLETVDLSNNRLRILPSNLQFFHNIKTLYLEGNPITHIEELPFALMWNLQTLSMSSCEVASISGDPFRNMEHLKELSLAGNQLTRVREMQLPRACAAVRLYISGNPWHCDCDMLSFLHGHHYDIIDLDDIRCASPRWLSGLRTAYLTKEILSLDSDDGDCLVPQAHQRDPSSPTTSTSGVTYSHPLHHLSHFVSPRADRLELFSLTAFALAAIFMVVHVLCNRKSERPKGLENHDDISYIRVDKKFSLK